MKTHLLRVRAIHRYYRMAADVKMVHVFKKLLSMHLIFHSLLMLFLIKDIPF